MWLYTGRVSNGESFTVEARTPRATFQYTISREPFTEPVVIVSYNDPQGNHRFVIPPSAMNLSHPADDLIAYSGEMLQDPGVEIVTTEPVDHEALWTAKDAKGHESRDSLSRISRDFAGVAVQNTLNLVVNNPSGVTLTDAHRFLEFVNISGTVASEVPLTVTLPAGPTLDAPDATSLAPIEGCR